MSNKKNNTSNLWIYVLIVVVILIVGISVLFKFPSNNNTNKKVDIPISKKDWIKGPEDAPLTLVEFGDFQCPACAQYFFLLRRLRTDFPKDIRIVYKHFPLTVIHEFALPAAKAAEAAGRQGAFWQMHDRLYIQQLDWSRLNDYEVKDRFVFYAGLIGLDKEKFSKDYDDPSIMSKINEEISLAKRLGVNATPTLFLNGEKLNLPRTYNAFKKLIEKKLKEIKSTSKDTKKEDSKKGNNKEESNDEQLKKEKVLEETFEKK